MTLKTATRMVWMLIPGMVLLCGCGRPAIDGTDGGTKGSTSSSEGSSADASTSGSTSGPSDTSSSGPTTLSTSSTSDTSTETADTESDDGGETGECWDEPEPCQFIPCPDVGFEPITCDAYLQDCPDGEKCAQLNNSITCAAVVPNPKQLGEDCNYSEWDSGVPDDCDAGLVCRAVPWWAVNNDGVEATCHPICGGSADSPVCPDGMFCEAETIPGCFDADECQG